MKTKVPEKFIDKATGGINVDALLKSYLHIEQMQKLRSPILKGIGKINGDGWKDSTKIGQIVFVWNIEEPPPQAPGQFPRVGNEIWRASTEQYDFRPATIEEIRDLFIVKPNVEALAFRRAVDDWPPSVHPRLGYGPTVESIVAWWGKHASTAIDLLRAAANGGK